MNSKKPYSGLPEEESARNKALNRKSYWSERQGRRPSEFLPPIVTRPLFVSLIDEFTANNLFQENFGYECVDSGFIPGKLGRHLPERLHLMLGRDNLWPITESNVLLWDDDTLFDMLELLFDYVSEGDITTGQLHSFSNCGWHFQHFVAAPAQAEFRKRIDELLLWIEPGFELKQNGIVRRLPVAGMSRLIINATLELDNRDTLDVNEAIEKYLSRSSLKTQRRDAVNQLAGVLERMRGEIKENMFSADENALFEIANKFWIRHNRPNERTDYDHEAWWSWLFYLYLDSIVLVSHLRNRNTEK